MEPLSRPDFQSLCEERLGFEPGDWDGGGELIGDLAFDSLDWLALDDCLADLGCDLFSVSLDQDLTVAGLYEIYAGSIAKAR